MWERALVLILLAAAPQMSQAMGSAPPVNLEPVVEARAPTPLPAGPYPLEIRSEAEDLIGQRLVFSLREKALASATFRLTSADEHRFVLCVLTMDRGCVMPGVSTIYSVVWGLQMKGNLAPIYLKGVVGFAGGDVLEDGAENILAWAAQSLEEALASAQKP